MKNNTYVEHHQLHRQMIKLIPKMNVCFAHHLPILYFGDLCVCWLRNNRKIRSLTHFSNLPKNKPHSHKMGKRMVNKLNGNVTSLSLLIFEPPTSSPPPPLPPSHVINVTQRYEVKENVQFKLLHFIEWCRNKCIHCVSVTRISTHFYIYSYFWGFSGCYCCTPPPLKIIFKTLFYWKKKIPSRKECDFFYIFLVPRTST